MLYKPICLLFLVLSTVLAQKTRTAVKIRKGFLCALHKGWESTSIITRIGLSEKPMIWFGFAFLELGLKSLKLYPKPKKKCFVV